MQVKTTVYFLTLLIWHLSDQTGKWAAVLLANWLDFNPLSTVIITSVKCLWVKSARGYLNPYNVLYCVVFCLHVVYCVIYVHNGSINRGKQTHLSFDQLQNFSSTFALTEDEDRSTGYIGAPPPCTWYEVLVQRYLQNTILLGRSWIKRIWLQVFICIVSLFLQLFIHSKRHAQD